MVTVRTNLELLEHLRTFEQDGATVAGALFEGGRLSYPGRRELEYMLGYTEPYTLELEARVIEGLPRRMAAAIRILADVAGDLASSEPTLDLLWAAHSTWRSGVSLDRLVAALVVVEMLVSSNSVGTWYGRDADLQQAAQVLVGGMHSIGFPPSQASLEELFDGAPPAAVGLGLVDL